MPKREQKNTLPKDILCVSQAISTLLNVSFKETVGEKWRVKD